MTWVFVHGGGACKRCPPGQRCAEVARLSAKIRQLNEDSDTVTRQIMVRFCPTYKRLRKKFPGGSAVDSVQEVQTVDPESMARGI